MFGLLPEQSPARLLFDEGKPAETKLYVRLLFVSRGVCSAVIIGEVLLGPPGACHH